MVASPEILLVNSLWTDSSKMISFLSAGDHTGLLYSRALSSRSGFFDVKQRWIKLARWCTLRAMLAMCSVKPKHIAVVGQRMTRFRYDRSGGTAGCHQHKREETRRTWQPSPQDPPCTIWKTADQGLNLAEQSTWRRQWTTSHRHT